MQETQAQSLSQEDPLEKEMTSHSSILTWRIPWTEEPGGLQCMRSQDLATKSPPELKVMCKSANNDMGTVSYCFRTWQNVCFSVFLQILKFLTSRRIKSHGLRSGLCMKSEDPRCKLQRYWWCSWYKRAFLGCDVIRSDLPLRFWGSHCLLCS